MIISGANDNEFCCLLYKLEQLNTRLDILIRNFLPKYCNSVTAYTNCCHDEIWSMFRNYKLSRTLIYSSVLVAFKTLFCHMLFVTTNFI